MMKPNEDEVEPWNIEEKKSNDFVMEMGSVPIVIKCSDIVYDKKSGFQAVVLDITMKLGEGKGAIGGRLIIPKDGEGVFTPKLTFREKAT